MTIRYQKGHDSIRNVFQPPGSCQRKKARSKEGFYFEVAADVEPCHTDKPLRGVFNSAYDCTLNMLNILANVTSLSDVIVNKLYWKQIGFHNTQNNLFYYILFYLQRKQEEKKRN